jgi:hypothetical protein
MRINNCRGAILIFSLWSLGLLVLFSLYLGVLSRQRLILLSRIERRDLLRSVARSGVNKALAALNAQDASLIAGSSARNKAFLMNNKKDFFSVDLGQALFDVYYTDLDKTFAKKITRYGMMNEESKLNINLATELEMVRLLGFLLNLDKESSEDIARSIVDWRESGEGVLTGFFSDRFYENLHYSYTAKNTVFDILDELLLVKGVTPDLYAQILPFITIFGTGQVDINTSSLPVLIALGLDKSVAGEILSVRRGIDREEGTADDIVFDSVAMFQQAMESKGSLSNRDIAQIQQLVDQGKFTVDGSYFTIQSRAYLRSQSEEMVVRCVYDVSNKKIVYWSEY